MQNFLKLRELGHDLSILYVEDNDDLREAFSIYFEKIFKSVKVCVDGREALEAFQNGDYDIVVTDINMPRMNGLEMSAEIKLLNPEQRIIIVSAYKNIDSYAEAIRLNIDGYILKPMEFEQVNAILAKICLQVINLKENITYKEHLEELVELKTQEIKRHYVTDALTGVPNRIALDERLQSNEFNTLVLLNVDNFSIVNNNFGFSIGDKIIQKIAKTLEDFGSDAFELFRMQADEFVFLAPEDKIEEAKTLAESIKEHFKTHNVVVEAIELNLSFTMAIDASATKDLLRSASLTLQKVRQIGKNHIGVYNPDSDFETLQKNNLLWIEKIKACMKNNTFRVFFQPIKDTKTQKIHKYEVLARIVTMENEIVGPHMFLKPLALAGLLSEFTRRIIDMAFAYVANKDVTISINVTGEDFRENYLVGYLEKKRQEYALSASSIVLEIVESVSAIDTDIVLEQLKALKALGYKIAIDDFGTENSNFSRLLTLQVDFIKIDGSFIKNIASDANSQEIVKAIVFFAHNIGCKVIAEFVHNQEVYDLIVQYGIDFAQGYHISEPKPYLMEG